MSLIKTYKYWLALIILLGAAFRIYGMWDMPLNLDERWHVYPAAVSSSLLEAILYHAKFDGHPPLTPIWTYLMLQVSDNNFWLRLPSLISGIMLIYVGFILGRKVGETIYNDSKSQELGIICGLILSSLIAFSNMTVIQSQIIRGYSVMMLCNALSYYAAIHYNFNNKSNKLIYYYVFSNIIGIISVHSSIFFTAAVGFVYFGAYIFTERNIKKSIAWCAANLVILTVFIASYAFTTLYGGAQSIMGPSNILKTQYNDGLEIFYDYIYYVVTLPTHFIFSSEYKIMEFYFIIFFIVASLIISTIFLIKNIKKYIFIFIISTTLMIVLEYIISSTISPFRRSSYILVPVFMLLSILISKIILKIQKFRLIATISFCMFLCTLSYISAQNLDKIDEYYHFSENDTPDFNYIGAADIMVNDGVSIMKQLYPNTKKLERIDQFVRALKTQKFPIYTYGYDFRGLQTIITIYDWKNYLKALENSGAFENKKTVWFWRKMPSWGYDVSMHLYCGTPKYINLLPNEQLKSSALVEWNNLSKKIHTEAEKQTPKELQERAVTSECKHVLYGLSVEFIKKEILEKEFIDVNTLIEKDIVEKGTNNDPRKIRRMQIIFENYRKGGSVL